jgi:effector-binding domain-containing protein
MRIASIRYLGDLAEVPARFAELQKTVEPYIAGDALRLLHWTLPTGKSDIEVAYPVSQDVNVGPVKTRTLPASEILSVQHEGPLSPPEAENSLTKTARPLYTYAVEREYLIAEGPFRLVYLAGGDELKQATEEQKVELQVPLFLTEWLSYLEEGLDKHAGDKAQERVMAGSDAIFEETEISERVAWTKGAMERLDEAVPDPEARCRIVSGCAHRFPKVLINEMRQTYQEAGSIDELLASMRRDRPKDGLPGPNYPKRVGNTIYEAKLPRDPKGYRNAENDLERRISYCFCPTLRAAMRAGETISPTFCNCGAGWFLQKDDLCEVAVHLPVGVT